MVCSILGVAAALTGAAGAETPRERCHETIEHGSKAAAIAACDDIVKRGGVAEDLWAASIARVATTEAPTMDELIRADVLAGAAERLAPGEPWGALARFEIARRWGDPALIEQRLRELERVAPADPRTAHAAALVAPTTSWLRTVLAGALLLLGAATVARVLRRRVRGLLRDRSTRASAAAVAALLAVWQPRTAVAADFPIDDANPERAVPTLADADAHPLEFGYYLQSLTERADAATQRGDHAAAARYVRALARAVPDSSLPLQRLCGSLVAAHEPDAAIDACRRALSLPGVRAEDFQRFVELVLGKRAPTPAELDDVAAAARHLADQHDTRALGLQLECRLGVRTASVPLLEECTTGLAAVRPADPQIRVFQWSLAIQQGHTDEARRLLDEVRAAGLGTDALARMEAATRDAASTSGRALVVLGLAVLLAGALVLVSRRRRDHAARTDQCTTTISGSA
jgi:hypothetical protein